MVAPPLKVKSTLQFPEPVNGILLGKKKKKKVFINVGFPGSSVVKNPPANTSNAGSILRSGRSPGEGNGNPLQHCLENSMDRGAPRATVHVVQKESDMT